MPRSSPLVLVRLVLGVLVLGVLVLGVPETASAQSAGAGARLYAYTFDDPRTAGLESFSLIAFPFAAAMSLGGGLSLGVGGAYARGEARGRAGGEATLSGFTDTDVTVRFARGDWLAISADASLPTGRSTLTTEESLVAGVVAAELLPFPVDTWGAGRRVGGTVAMATQAGRWGLGMSAGYRVAGSFEPLPDQPLTYDPGDELQLRVAIDRDVAGSSTLGLVVGLQRFSDDELLQTNLFRSGSRIDGVLSLAFPLGARSSALVYAGLDHRSRGTLLLAESVLSGAGDSPSQQLLLTGANVRLPVGRRAAVLPRTELRVFRAEDGASQGWVASAGSALDLRLVGNSAGRRLILSPTGDVRIGRVIVEEGARTGLFGWEVGLTLRAEGGR